MKSVSVWDQRKRHCVLRYGRLATSVTLAKCEEVIDGKCSELRPLFDVRKNRACMCAPERRFKLSQTPAIGEAAATIHVGGPPSRLGSGLFFAPVCLYVCVTLVYDSRAPQKAKIVT